LSPEYEIKTQAGGNLLFVFHFCGST